MVLESACFVHTEIGYRCRRYIEEKKTRHIINLQSNMECMGDACGKK